MNTPGGGTPPAVSAGEPSQREELAYWESVRESRDRTALLQFLTRFPQSRFRSTAERRLEDLDREDPAATAGRFLEALRTGDLGAAYGPAADRVRQFTPESSFGAMVKASLREPVAPAVRSSTTSARRTGRSPA